MTPQPRFCKPDPAGKCPYCNQRPRRSSDRCPAADQATGAKITSNGARTYTATGRDPNRLKGLGDLLEVVFRRLGIKAAVEWINAKLGSTCDCDRRKKLYNEWVPFCGRSRLCWVAAWQRWRALLKDRPWQRQKRPRQSTRGG